MHVTVCPFVDANALLKAILKAAKGISISPEEMKTEINVQAVSDNPGLLGKIIDKVVGVAVSQEVEDALFKCFQRATYEDIRITRELFDDPKIGEKAREDYFKMCVNVISVNCQPFFKQAFSALKASAKKPLDIQAST
jgi:hypothetical protein